MGSSVRTILFKIVWVELVRQLDCCWNRLVPSLYLLHGKLADLGVVIINDTVSYVESKEVGHV
jgi:hypothetical protein